MSLTKRNIGKRFSVEKSIIEGVKTLQNSNGEDEKIGWLFDLRNELMHGGSRYIEEWSKYLKYRSHFSSYPSDDIEKLAFSSLYNAPFIL